jgi:hypothetical protein
MLKRFEKLLRSIIAEVVCDVVKEGSKDLVFTIADLHRETTSSFQTLSAMHVETLRLLNLMEQSQPACCTEKQRLLNEVRDSTAALVASVKKLHPELNG